MLNNWVFSNLCARNLPFSSTCAATVITILTEVFVILRFEAGSVTVFFSQHSSRINVLWFGNRYITDIITLCALGYLAYVTYLGTAVVRRGQTISSQGRPSLAGVLIPGTLYVGASVRSSYSTEPGSGGDVAYPILPSVSDFVSLAFLVWRIYVQGVVLVMLRNGAFYFACLLLVNIAVAVTFSDLSGELGLVLSTANPWYECFVITSS